MYAQESRKVAMRPRKHAIPEGGVVKVLAAAGAIGDAQGRTHALDDSQLQQDELLQRDAYGNQAADDKEEADEPQLHMWVAVFALAASTAVVALCAEFMVDSISAITSGNSGISVVRGSDLASDCRKCRHIPIISNGVNVDPHFSVILVLLS
jgi:Ca2+:H+ antiporter